MENSKNIKINESVTAQLNNGKKTKYNDSQLKAISDTSENILVSASAGSGKTSVMIERVLRLITEGKSLKNMAIVTFTKASAMDMADKLNEKLTEKRESIADKNCQLYAHLTSELEELSVCNISTIHSLCQRFLKKYFFVVGIDPNFEIADTLVATKLLGDIISKNISSALNSDSEFILLYDRLYRKRSDRNITDFIRKIYYYATTTPDPKQWLENADKMYSSTKSVEYVENHYSKEKKALLAKIKSLELVARQQGFEAILPAFGSLIANAEADTFDVMRTSFRGLDGDKSETNESYKALKAELKELASERVKIDTVASLAGVEPKVRSVINVVSNIIDEFAEEKKQKGILDFGDLEHKMFQLLSDENANASIRKELQYLFVDEYQDINPLQEGILSSLGGAMFCVGDVKQSIYGFRQCDPDIFVGKQEKFRDSSAGVTIALNANYRSRREILSYVNSVFAPIMTEEFGSVDYYHNQMEAGREIDCSLSAVDCKYLEKEKDLFVADSVYSVKNDMEETTSDIDEAKAITDEIVGAIGKSYTLNGEVKQLALGDIVVLVRNSGNFITSLKQNLEDLGIPVWVNKKQSLLCETELSALFDYLTIINNSHNDISLYNVMTSYFGDFSEQDLAKVRLTMLGEEFFYQAIDSYIANNSDELSQRLAEFLAKIMRYHEMSYYMNVDELVGRICADSYYFVYLSSTENGAIRVNNVAGYIERLASMPQNNSLYDYISSVDREDKSEVVECDSRDSVRIMTIHNSKGLEFDYVILAQTAHMHNLSDATKAEYILDRELGIALVDIDKELSQNHETTLTLASRLKVKKRLLEEEMRVLYVAITRAKLHLSVYATFTSRSTIFDKDSGEIKKGEASRHFADWLMTASILPEKIEVAGGETKAPKRKLMFSQYSDSLEREVKENLEWRYPHKIGAVTKTSVTAIMNETDEEQTHNFIGEYDDRALEIGNSYHHLMQATNFDGDYLAQYERFALCSEGRFIDKDKYLRCAKTIEKLVDGYAVYKEKEFVLAISDSVLSGEVLAQGIIDLLAIKGDEAIVVDYKTTRVSDILTDKYIKQLEIYSEAVKKILGISKVKTYIYSFFNDSLSHNDNSAVHKSLK